MLVTIAVVLAVWLSVAIALALLLGAMIRTADRREGVSARQMHVDIPAAVEDEQRHTVGALRLVP